MNTDERNEQPPREPDNVADTNVARLLSEAYRPEMPDADFVAGVQKAMREAAQQRQAASSDTRPALFPEARLRPGSLGEMFATVAITLGFVIGLVVLLKIERAGQVPNDPRGSFGASSLEQDDSSAWAAPTQRRRRTQHVPVTSGASARITARRREVIAPETSPPIGETITTAVGQRRRLSLTDGSIVYLNENTSIVVDAERRMTLRQGEVYVEVAPRDEAPAGEEGGPATFLVKTPHRDVAALGTKFSVRALADSTGVVVVQGKVHVEDVQKPLVAGQQLVAKSAAGPTVAPLVSAAPRASHTLSWTQDLMAAAESPLVPASQHAGGSLVVVDPDGQETRLSLRKYHVDVHIEDGFARTTIDQTYFNHLSSRQEGTFHFPLPGDASISRLAMYVGGRLMEGGMIERNRGRDVFETIKYRSLDPALLEWVDGSTFKMRVFPLEGREEKRIVLSYTQRLDSLYGQLKYRFPAGHSLGKVDKWSAQVHVNDGASWDWHSASHQLNERKQDGHLILSAAAEDVEPDRDLALLLTERSGNGQVVASADVARFSTATHEGFTYLMLRHRPQLDSPPVRPHRDWVFLFESSADRNPLLARVQVDAIKSILDHAEHDDTFSIVTVGTRATVLNAQPLLATPANVAAAIERLEQTHLVGALDLEQGLLAAAELFGHVRGRSPDLTETRDRRSPSVTGRPAVDSVLRSGDHATTRAGQVPQPVIVHLGSGNPVLGVRAVDQLTGLIPPRAQYIGVAVGKRWNRGFMRTAAARRGGYFTQINPDETVSWRTFDLLATLDTPRLMEVAAEDSQNRQSWLSFDHSLAQGEELAVVTRFKSGHPLPKSVILTGRLDGETYRHEIPVANVAPEAEYLPRMWAKLEIDRLVAGGSVDHKDEIIKLSKAMYVMSPFTSLLVLENDQMYAQYKVDRGRKDHWALYPCPEKIPVVREPLGVVRSEPAEQKDEEAKQSKDAITRKVLQTIYVRVPPQVLNWAGQRRQYGGRTVDIWTLNLPVTAALAPDSLTDVDRALVWLARHRSPNGSWKYHQGNVRSGWSTNATGFALLPYLGAGSPGAEFDVAIENGVKELLARTISTDTWLEMGGSTSIARREPDVNVPIGATMSMNSVISADRRYVHITALPFFSNVTAVTQYNLARGEVSVNHEDNWPFRVIVGGQTLPSPYYLSDDIQYFTPGPEFRMRSGTAAAQLPFVVPPDRPIDLDVVLEEAQTGRLTFGVGVNSDAGLVGTIVIDEKNMIHPRRLWDVDYDSIPFPDYPPIVYPSPEVWEELTRRRKRYGSVDVTKPLITMLVTDFDRRVAYLDDDVNGPWDIDIDSEGIPGNGTTLRGWPASYVDQINVRFSETTPDPRLPATATRNNRPDYKHYVIPTTNYSTPGFLGNDEVFGDLLAFAPGMNTSRADVFAKLKSEGGLPLPKLGEIDVRARKLIAKARAQRWYSLSIGGQDDQQTVQFDLSGRYRFERTTSDGLKEIVVCDGQKLWHVYPELGVAAQRTATAWHTSWLSRLVPWMLPPVKRLARGVDLKMVDQQTVALLPHGIEKLAERKDKDGKPVRYAQSQLVFATDGRLVERRIVEMPGAKTLWRMTFDEEGTITWFDQKGKQQDRSTPLTTGRAMRKLVTATQPRLAPDLKDLVVVPMPWRSSAHVLAQRKLDLGKGNYADWSEEDAIAVAAALCAERDYTSAGSVIGQRFFSPRYNDRRIGLYTLLLAAGARWDRDEVKAIGEDLSLRVDPAKDQPDSKLATYFAEILDRHLNKPKKTVVAIGGDSPTLIDDIARFHRFLSDYRDGQRSGWKTADREQLRSIGLKFALTARSPRMRWAVASILSEQRSKAEFHLDLAEVYGQLSGVPERNYIARYEQARHLHRAGRSAEARRKFSGLYGQTLTAGVLPPQDDEFRQTYEATDNGHNAWRTLMQKTATELIEKDQRNVAIALAWQCRKVGSPQLADELATLALDVDQVPLPLCLAGIEYWRTGQKWNEAEDLLSELLANETISARPAIWYLAAVLSDRRGRLSEAASRHERALQLAYGSLEEKIDVTAVRRDFGALLSRYEKLVTAVAEPGADPPTRLVARIIGAADRWRALETDVTTVCQTTGRLLRTLGAEQLAWDYLTTPVAGRATESAPWVTLAAQLREQGEYDLSDRSYTAAHQAEPTNPEILWEHAQMLDVAGQDEASVALVNRIAEGNWQPRFQSVQAQAKRVLEANKIRPQESAN